MLATEESLCFARSDGDPIVLLEAGR